MSITNRYLTSLFGVSTSSTRSRTPPSAVLERAHGASDSGRRKAASWSFQKKDAGDLRHVPPEFAARSRAPQSGLWRPLSMDVGDLRRTAPCALGVSVESTARLIDSRRDSRECDRATDFSRIVSRSDSATNAQRPTPPAHVEPEPGERRRASSDNRGTTRERLA